MPWHKHGVVRAWAAPGLLLGTGVVALVDSELGGRLVDDPFLTLATIVAAYLVGAWLRPALAGLTSMAAVALLTGANQMGTPGQYTALNDFFFFAVLVGGLALVGNLVSARAAQVRELRQLTRVREEQRNAEIEAARLEERTRVDAAVTRSMMQRMSALVLQASGVRSAIAPTRDRSAVARVEAVGREALEELREVLGSLREPVEPAEELDTPPAQQEPPPGWVDVVVGCCGIPVAVESATSSTTHGRVLATTVLALALGAPLVWRRTRPFLAAAGFFAIAALMAALLTPLTGLVTVLLPLSLAAYALGAHTRGARRGAGLALLLAGGVLLTLADPSTAAKDAGLVPTLAWLAIAFGAGVLAAQYADRAARLTDLLSRIESGREHQVRLAVAEQRQHIARDLHDTVAHVMTIVCLHAEAAQQQWSDDQAVEQSLTVIESAAREAMGHLRAGLGALETEADLTSDATEELPPEVRAFAGSLGVPVTVSAEVALASSERALVLRVVHEALVNIARHAPGSSAQVLVTRRAETLVVRVTNPPGGTSLFTHGAGLGLAGLDELLTARGGSVEHGHTADGGYAVTAYLPTSAAWVPA